VAYERPSQAGGTPVPPLDAFGHLARYCGWWMRRAGVHKMPAPMPYSADEAARWWVQVMCPPQPAIAGGRGGDGWDDAGEDGRATPDTGWLAEARSALRGFLAMNTREREAVVRLVTDEGIPYRGESFAQYLQICAETDLCREDPATYRREALRAALARVKRLAAPGASRTDAIPAPERMGAAC
jgi:hypothetical protein